MCYYIGDNMIGSVKTMALTDKEKDRVKEILNELIKIFGAESYSVIPDKYLTFDGSTNWTIKINNSQIGKSYRKGE